MAPLGCVPARRGSGCRVSGSSEGSALPFSNTCAVRFRKSIAQRLRKAAFRAHVLEFVALFLFGASGVGIRDADVPEGVFGKHDLERLADGSLQRFAGFEDFHVQFFARGKGRILHDAIKNDSRDLRGIPGRFRRRFLRQGGHSRKQNDYASIDFQQNSRILTKNSK